MQTPAASCQLPALACTLNASTPPRLYALTPQRLPIFLPRPITIILNDTIHPLSPLLPDTPRKSFGNPSHLAPHRSRLRGYPWVFRVCCSRPATGSPILASSVDLLACFSHQPTLAANRSYASIVSPGSDDPVGCGKLGGPGRTYISPEASLLQASRSPDSPITHRFLVVLHGQTCLDSRRPARSRNWIGPCSPPRRTMSMRGTIV